MIDKFISQVRCPSRYIGSEINSIHKDHTGKLKIALIFPDLYEIGMSHLGLQIIYFMLNQYDEVVCERAFAPASDMEELILRHKIPWVSHESKTPLKDFDILAFTLPSELNYTTVLNILQLSHIPLRSSERDEGSPFILGGGACSLNPEPVADFFDAIFLGEVEDSINLIVQKLKKVNSMSRKEFLREFCEVPGIYVPSFFEPVYNPDNTIKEIRPLLEKYTRVQRQVVRDFDKSFFPEKFIVPFTQTIHDRLTVEIARGCTQGCRFCHAGTIYRPTRERSVKRIIENTDKALKNTGYEELSLMSLSAGDYSQIEGLVSSLISRYESKKIAVSLPSLRVGTISEELLKQIRSVRKTGITIALEAGTERLRRVINKNITEDDALKMVQTAFRLGWKGIKLYFMIGLPSETEDDIKGIIDLARKLSSQGTGDITVSLATFIPKPHTPFQWERQMRWEEAELILKDIKKTLKNKYFKVKWQDPKLSFVEGVLSRGDRKLSYLLEKAIEKGCKLDSWSDFFDFSKWESAFAETKINPEFYIRERNEDEKFPWEHLDSLVTKEFLLDERKRALSGETTEDCFTGRCSQCGACDFKQLEPQHAPEYRDIRKQGVYARYEAKYRLRITKAGMMKYLSHLEYIRVIERALRRTGLPMEFSEGFHPAPKFSFSPAIPVGVESFAEYMDITLSFSLDEEDVMERINNVLPDGISVAYCEEIPLKAPPVANLITEMKYEVKLDSGLNRDIAERVEQYNNLPTFPVYLEYKEKEIDAKKVIPKLYLSGEVLKFSIILNAGAGGINPVIFVKTLLNIKDEQLSSVEIIKVDTRFGK
jgi:radical SAM family uncharacterized protein/radical SAM-linked protein